MNSNCLCVGKWYGKYIRIICVYKETFSDWLYLWKGIKKIVLKES